MRVLDYLRSKLIHDMMVLRKDFAPSMKVLLYDLKLHSFPSMGSARWFLLLLLMYFLMVQLRYMILLLESSRKLMVKDKSSSWSFLQGRMWSVWYPTSHAVISDMWWGSLGAFCIWPGSIILSLIYGEYNIFGFFGFSFCFIPSMLSFSQCRHFVILVWGGKTMLHIFEK